MPTATASPVQATDHLEWAAQIARRVARKGRFRGQELLDLISAAQLALLEKIADGGFDADTHMPSGGEPIGAFRGWAYLTIRCACVREAMRLRGGGTFDTRRPVGLVIADPMGDSVGVFEDEPAKPTPDAALGNLMLDDKPSRYGRTFRRGNA